MQVFHILTRGRSDENIAMNSIVLSHICVFVSDFSNNKRIPIKKHIEVFQEVYYLIVFDRQTVSPALSNLMISVPHFWLLFQLKIFAHKK